MLAISWHGGEAKPKARSANASQSFIPSSKSRHAHPVHLSWVIFQRQKKLRTTKFRPHEESGTIPIFFFEKTRQCIWLNSHISKKTPNSWKAKAISLLSYLLGGRSMTLRWLAFHCCAKCSKNSETHLEFWATSSSSGSWVGLKLCFFFKTNTIRYGECFSLTKIKLIAASLLPSTQVLQRSRWFGGGNLAENSRWIMYQMICFSQDKPMESNLIW